MTVDLRNSISYFTNNIEAFKRSLNTFIKPHGQIKEQYKDVLLDFWFSFFDHILREGVNDSLFTEEDQIEIEPTDTLLQEDGITIRNNVSKSIFIKVYKDKVFQLLEDNKSAELSSEGLKKLQLEIESLTMDFNEENIYSSCSILIKEMSDGNQISAKDYLKGKYKFDKKEDDLNRIKVISSKDNMKEVGTQLYNALTPYEKQLLDQFSHHTIEALLIHIMSTLFSSENCVKVATLVERIENAVRQNAAILASINGETSVVQNSKIPEKDVLRLPFGKALVEFLVERHMIKIIHKEKDVNSSSTKIIKKNKSFYLEKSVYAECLFNPAILPVQMNLPMIYPPMDWKSHFPPNDKTWLNISDLYGGYLKGHSTEIYGQYRIFSSVNINNFIIYFGKNKDKKSHDKADSLCNIMNKLQKQAFKINKFFLNEMTSNVHFYVGNGFLMPSYLNNININGCVTTILRDYYLNNKEVQDICSYNKLLQVMSTNIQRARYERTIFNLAKAYADYQFYLPAFLDFRGRIYRCGILHFHERDLARSLIQIVDESDTYQTDYNYNTSHYDFCLGRMVACAAFHYQKFSTYYDAMMFIGNRFHDIKENIPDNGLKVKDHLYLVYLEFAKNAASEAKNPFQFLSLLQGFLYCNDLRKEEAILHMNSYPITQDASASAYQIMSYFMLDETMGLRTNLIPSKDALIQDIYDFFRMELLSFLKDELDEHVYTSIESFFTRKLVKSIFMPLIYGKTLMSTNDDIKAVLSQYMTHKECFNITRLCFKFWSTKYEHMDCLIRLIRIIGWFASTCDRPVLYQTDFFNTSQDYRVMEPYSIWVYDKTSKKRRKVTLRVSSDTRDRKKTEVSTFVNFIHKKDAYIAMSVVLNLVQSRERLCMTVIVIVHMIQLMKS
ncbi:hypothetical protein ACS0TY_001800 [Phlomoides rotata]